MQRCLSSSLYWYVEKSLEDMLEGYMLFLKDDQTSLGEEAAALEMNQLITQMLELPLEFDSTSRQLSVSLILSAIQRHIKSTQACKYLLVTMLRRNVEISKILKSDFLMILEQVFFRDVKKEEYVKPEVKEKSFRLKLTPIRGWSMLREEDEGELHPKLESRAYAEILVELYQKDFVSATEVLVYLEQLSKKEPSYYHTDLLLFLLSRIGTSVENKLSRGSYILRNSVATTPTSSSGCYTGSRTTFDGIFKRLDSLVPYAISTESQKALKKIIDTRKMKVRSKTKKTRSKDSIKHASIHRGQNQKIPDIIVSAVDNENVKVEQNDEGITAL